MKRVTRKNPIATIRDVDIAVTDELTERFENIVGHYETETLDLFDRMDVRPDFDRRDAINTLIGALKESNLWDRLDGLYLFAAHTQQAALLNWRRDAANMTAVNSPTFTTDVGFTGDGATTYLSNVSSDVVNMGPTNISISLWIKTRHTTGSWDLSMSGWEARIVTNNDSAGWRLSESTGDSVTVSNVNQPGLYTTSRSSDVGSRIFKDGGRIKTNTLPYNVGGTYSTTTPIYIGAPAGTSSTDGQYSMASYGGAMTDGEAALFYNAINTYMDAVGVV